MIQTMGRAARHIDGQVIMYADVITGSMQRAIDETKRRRSIQQAYNKEHNITPQGIRKAIKDITQRVKVVFEEKVEYSTIPENRAETTRLIKELEKQMKITAKNMEFEKAALLRDRIIELRRQMLTAELPQ